MTLSERVHAVFAHGGTLAQAWPGYRLRAGQREMALAVAAAIESGEGLAVEAGTGVGKTLAYLVPALLSGRSLLVCTATRTLQDQLRTRDVPQLTDALGLAARVAVIKGRRNYLCIQRLAELEGTAGLPAAAASEFQLIRRWAGQTRTGDFAEGPPVLEQPAWRQALASGPGGCLGADCPHLAACHVAGARRDAQAADVVIANHHLFFADLLARRRGWPPLLPETQIRVFDEAHQLPETGGALLGPRLGTAELIRLARDLARLAPLQAPAAAPWQALAEALESAARDLRLAAGPSVESGRIPLARFLDDRGAASEWRSAWSDLGQALADLTRALHLVAGASPALDGMAQQVQDAQARWTRFGVAPDEQPSNWVEVGTQLDVATAPDPTSEALRLALLEPPSQAGVTTVYTSATLGHEPTLRWFTDACGLAALRTLSVPSPFDHAAQAALYVPPDIDWPSSPDHPLQVARVTAGAVRALGGRTLVLAASLRGMRAIGEALRQTLADTPAIEVLVQGEWPRERLLQRLRGAWPATGGCVVVASGSLWEGVDVPGEDLQLVVIDKLPFPTPDDPLVQARGRAVVAAGRSLFAHLVVPETAVALRQGAGRLIRHERDRGVLVVGDRRLLDRPYGRRILAALPTMPRLADATAFAEALKALTRASTRDRTTA